MTVTRALKILPRHFERYNQPTCIKADVSPDGLEAMRMRYHEVRGQPDFIDDFLHLKPGPPQMRMATQHPQMVQWSDDGSLLILPNGGDYRPENALNSPADFNDRTNGMALVAWYVHPKQLEETVFSEPANRSDFLNAATASCYAPKFEPKNKAAKKADQQRIREIESQSGIPYLASLLDLRKEHVPWLKQLRSLAVSHLKERYGVKDDDHLSLYSHLLIGEPTTTFHLHIRVNQGVHPLEGTERFMLDDVIEALEKGRRIEELVLSRQAHFRDSTDGIEFMKELPGVKILEIDNPLIIESPMARPSHGKPCREYQNARMR